MTPARSTSVLRRAAREIRVLPILIVATAALLGLKLIEIAADAPGAVGGAREVLAQETAEEPSRAVSEETPDAEETASAEEGEDVEAADTGSRSAEEAINIRLAERRKQLDKFEEDLKLRENLLKATEMRIEQRIKELQALEGRLNAAIQERDDAEKQRFQNLITMYEAMKPKDAARVFNELETRILVEVATGLDPRKMGEIMAKMSADAAERLTIAMMNTAAEKPRSMQVEDLPQIMGTRSGS